MICTFPGVDKACGKLGDEVHSILPAAGEEMQAGQGREGKDKAGQGRSGQE